MTRLTLAVVLAAQLSPSIAAACVEGSGRTGYAMTYDAARKRVLMFGGEADGGRRTNDLLAWDGSRWSCISSEGPSPRSDGALAYDAGRGVVVLYGGRSGRAELRDTWELRNDRWTRRDTAGPTPEPHGVAAYSAAAKGILLYAGLGDDSPARRTWLLADDGWKSVAHSPAAEFPNAAFDGTNGEARLLTARRLGPGRYRPSEYQWRAGGWSEMRSEGDHPEFSPQAPAAMMPAGMVLYAGFEEDRSVKTWVREGNRWRRHDGASPPRRKGAKMTFDAARGVAVLHGGDDGDRILDDTWEWNGRSWTRVR